LKLSPTARGLLWMSATGVLFTVLNATLKKISHEMEPWVVGFLRHFLGALVMLVPALRPGVRALWPKAPRLQLVRGLFHGCGMLLWFAAMPLVTLAELTAVGFTGPIFICLGAVLFLGERMSGARWAAVALGFAGVMLVVWPGAQGGGHMTGILLMLASAPAFAGSFLVAKVLTRTERPDIVVLWQHLLVALFLAPFAAVLWVSPSAAQWALLILCGFVGAGGHYCMTRAFHVADISAVQPARFLELVWAALLGMAIFHTLPDAWTIAGGVLILAGTLWLARHESRGT